MLPATAEADGPGSPVIAVRPGQEPEASSTTTPLTVLPRLRHGLPSPHELVG